MGEICSTYGEDGSARGVFVVKVGKRQLGMPGHKWGDYIKTNLKKK